MSVSKRFCDQKPGIRNIMNLNFIWLALVLFFCVLYETEPRPIGPVAALGAVASVVTTVSGGIYIYKGTV